MGFGFDEVSIKRLEKLEDDINESLYKIGEGAHRIGILKHGVNSEVVDRIKIASEILCEDRDFVSYAVLYYLDNRINRADWNDL